MSVFSLFVWLKKFDWFSTAAAVLLGGFGLLILTIAPNGASDDLFVKQVIFLVSGLVLMLALSRINFDAFRFNSLPLVVVYLLTVFLLAAVLFWGSEIRGAQSWFRLGPLNFQPSEFAKIALILVLAKYFSFRHVELYRAWHIVVSALYAAVPGVLTLVQPDLGTAFVFFCVWLGMVVAAGLPMKRLGLVVLLASIIGVGIWFFALAPYQKDRLVSYLNPYQDPLGQGYNQLQSIAAIGSGGLFGAGLENALQTRLGFLPEAHNDFIFAALSEAFGVFGAAIVLAIFVFLILRLLSFAYQRRQDQFIPPSNFGRLYAAGFGILILTELIINVGMNLGLLPVTGLSLPFVSYGGSQTIFLLAGLGVYQAFFTRTR